MNNKLNVKIVINNHILTVITQIKNMLTKLNLFVFNAD